MAVRSSRRSFLTLLAATPVLASTACSSSRSSSPSSSSSGVLNVAVEPYAPYTTVQNGKIVGLDGDILNYVAGKLGLQVKPQVTDFAGMLAGVQSGRVDITIGGIAWTADRQKQGLFTDPPYYSPPAMAVRSGKTYRTISDLKGLNLGTVTGYVWVKLIQAVPGATLHAYPTAEAVFEDLAAGRIDVGFLDPLLIIAAQKADPGMKIATEYLTPPSLAEVAQTPAYQYFRPYQTGFYLPKKDTALEQSISAQIDAMYKSGELSTLVEKYGGDPQQFLVPTADMTSDRRGADRPATWTAPSISI
jgi:ABC-type amino acid transport substrate-binding protein